MKIFLKSALALMTVSLAFNSKVEAIPETPKLTVVFVADALSEELVVKVEPFLTGGIKFLKNNGVNFTNAFHASGNCSSAGGHADFATGTFATAHGMVNNIWLDSDSRFFTCFNDKDLANTGVFNPVTGNIYGSSPEETNQSIVAFYGHRVIFSSVVFGVSPRNYKADTVADQLILNSNAKQTTKVYSIAKEALEAILMGGQLAHTFWMDGPTGLFTTSKYYFPEGLPDWVKAFNHKHPIPPTFIWEPVYPLGSAAYNFPDAQNYQFSYVVPGVLPLNATVLGQELTSVIPVTSFLIGALGALNYNIGPLGVQRTFEFAKEVINRELNLNNNNERLVIYLNIDSVDGTSSVFGMQSQDNIDMVYRIDKELGDFLKFIYNKVPRSDVFFAFISDEGNMGAIPELLQQSGFGLARRTLGDNLVTQFNTALGANYIQTILPPFLYMNLPVFSPLAPATQAMILSQVKDLLRATPGIKDAWTFDELISWPFEREDLGRFFKLQLYRNIPGTVAMPQERRSGEIIFQTTPFNLLTVSAVDLQPTLGQDHISVYNYDAHVPMYIYQHGRFARQTISTPVLMQQFAISLSNVLNVPRPSAAPPEIHPLPFISNQDQ